MFYVISEGAYKGIYDKYSWDLSKFLGRNTRADRVDESKLILCETYLSALEVYNRGRAVSSNQPVESCKENTLENITDLSNEHDSCFVYTDGSASTQGRVDKITCGFYLWSAYTHLELPFAVNRVDNRSNDDFYKSATYAEGAAICFAIHTVNKMGYKHCIIRSDCKTLVSALTKELPVDKKKSIEMCKMVDKIKTLISYSKCKITINWVKGHKDTRGNIISDQLATIAKDYYDNVIKIEDIKLFYEMSESDFEMYSKGFNRRVTRYFGIRHKEIDDNSKKGIVIGEVSKNYRKSNKFIVKEFNTIYDACNYLYGKEDKQLISGVANWRTLDSQIVIDSFDDCESNVYLLCDNDTLVLDIRSKSVRSTFGFKVSDIRKDSGILPHAVSIALKYCESIGVTKVHFIHNNSCLNNICIKRDEREAIDADVSLDWKSIILQICKSNCKVDFTYITDSSKGDRYFKSCNNAMKIIKSRAQYVESKKILGREVDTTDKSFRKYLVVGA